jgi:hypothetical protein
MQIARLLLHEKSLFFNRGRRGLRVNNFSMCSHFFIFGGQLANFHVMPSARVEGGSEVLVPILRLHAKDFLQLCPPRVGSR